MTLLIDLFGYLSIVIHGLVIVAQSAALGAVLFLAFLGRPLGLPPRIARRIAAIGAWSAVGLVVAEGATVAMQVALLAGTVDLPVGDVMGANFAVAGLIKTVAAALIAALLFARGSAAPIRALLAIGLVELAAATLTTHAAARLDERAPLLAAAFLHQFGAALWIGGIPAFVVALARTSAPPALLAIAGRFSAMSMAGVACILGSGIVMCWFYIATPSGFYGTAYGVMVGAKIAMFAMLLLLGLGNFLLTRRLRADPATPVLRMRRFAEVEVGIGITIFFAAASLTSVPPAVDLTTDRVTVAEIVERNTPRLPRMVSPDHDVLALPALQAKLDAEAARRQTVAAAAFVPGSGDLPDRNAADIAWSEYNHHWAGVFVVAIGLLALLNQAGVRWARHWPLLFLGLGVFLFLRSDPEVWPLGEEGILVSLRDVEVLQHRMFVALTFVFAIFEWRVRTGRTHSPWAPLVFPLICAAGGALLFTHSHAVANVKDQLLIELTHTPLALAAVVAGWARWLDLRLDPVANRRTRAVAAWTWPVCLTLIGVILLLYREA